ncbi:arabinan endo-1,5-alpha-L-arabinosidase [Gramella sp. AN32]|uniref:Arabinan endo-1,5-alpha-L-arabinosidase n=1 Tax=Christiangramia antarctica TaxID=2058158 RepID=A0ABW5XAA1_9FLAO|nr:arabinan endo-1,5-alpha-L-arabinosidase [Gramella sp. AN32]MCM4157299.1 arabinan endo-1,5-alpha-L-arabinosidase [Gramella sp. AN32]
MKTFKILSALIFLGILSSQAQDTRDIRVHDPVVAKEGDTYYLFNTGKGIGVYSSKDLKDWKPEPSVFTEKPAWTDSVVPNFKNHIWAPDIIKKDSTWYLYYSVSAFAKNTSAIGVATNKTLNPKDPDYKWTDQGIVIRSIPNRDMWNAIDPNVIYDKEGTPWMAFGSFWNGLKMVKLSEELTQIAEPQEWYTIASRKRSFGIPSEDPGDAALEAPFIFKKGNWYYQFLSWDLCCRAEKSTYKVVVGRSKQVTGPYVDKDGKSLNEGGGTLLLQGNKNWYGAGHNSVYNFDGKDYMFFHAYDANDKGAPKLGIKEVKWKNGWPSVEPMNEQIK